MIRRLHEADRQLALALLNRQPELNLYMLGNLETLGFGADYCEFWGDFEEDLSGTTTLRAILNRYMTGWTVFGLERADWPGLGHVLDSAPGTATRLQDNPGGIDSFLPYLSAYRAGRTFSEELMTLDAAAFVPLPPPPGLQVRRATMDDLHALTPFYANAESMTRMPASIERPVRDTRLWIALETGTVVAAALTNAETVDLAMIGGVYTLPSRRGCGFSQAVCSALCAELLSATKRPVLYWESPAAGRVYRKLGFQPAGVWRSVWLQEVS